MKNKAPSRDFGTIWIIHRKFFKNKAIKDKVEAFNNLVSKWEDTLVLIDLANEENDESMLPDVVSATEEIEADIDKMTLETLF